jgi:predicted naringenin-chalcone synthase
MVKICQPLSNPNNPVVILVNEQKVTGQKVTKLLGQKVTGKKVTIYIFYPGGQKVTGQKITILFMKRF